MMLLRNILFYLGIIPAVFLFTLLALFLFFIPYKKRYWLMTRWSYFFIFWAKIAGGLKYQVEGMHHLPTSNAIVLSNHQSTWETIFFQTLLPPQCWVLKKSLLYIPGFGWSLALLEPIAIQRKQLNSIRALLKQGIERLNQGRWIVIFPEGTRVIPGKYRRFSRTGAALAKFSHTPIIPIAHNAGEFWPRGIFIRKTGTIRIVIGPAINPHEQTATEMNTAAEHWIRGTLTSLSIANVPSNHHP